MRIEWDEPYLNSAPIDAYEIFVGDSDGNFNLESTYCNGYVEPVLTERYCEIPMTVLRTGQYNLDFGGLVQAKVIAKNVYGWSSMSDANSDGAKIQT